MDIITVMLLSWIIMLSIGIIILLVLILGALITRMLNYHDWLDEQEFFRKFI